MRRAHGMAAPEGLTDAQTGKHALLSASDSRHLSSGHELLLQWYEKHTPAHKRWFVATVTAMKPDGMG